MQPYNLLIPLKTDEDLWSFVNPMAYQVWICALGSIPIYILAMGLVEYLSSSSGIVDWPSLVGFVLRNAFHENIRLPDKGIPRKLLIIIWIWSAFIVCVAYAGNLIAMLTNPKLDRPVRKPEDLLNQEDLSWVVEAGIGAVEYMSASPPGSTWRKIYEKIEEINDWEWEEEGMGEGLSACFSYSTYYSGKHASICDIDSIRSHMHYNFSGEGLCHWYITDNNFFEVSSVMVFQVMNLPIKNVFKD